jgi:hypothetical protein
MGIPSYCCIGSLSAGGRVDYEATRCNKSLDVYERAEQVARAFMPPLPTKTKSTECDWCRILDVLMQYNWTLAFAGDSLTRQVYFGLECELHRRGLYDISLERTWSQTQLPKPRWRYGLDEIWELRVTKKQRFKDTTFEHNTTAIVRLYAMYRPNEDMHEVDQYILSQGNDVLIFDHGLHYGVATGEDVFVEETTNLLRTLVHGHANRSSSSSHSKTKRPFWKLLAWRETSAQHFDTHGGHFEPQINESYCVPLVPQQDNDDPMAHVHQTNRLRPLLESVAKSLNLTSTTPYWTILPFRAYTSRLHELHAAGDCSHFCTTPSLWLPLWRHLRLAVDQAVDVFQGAEEPPNVKDTTDTTTTRSSSTISSEETEKATTLTVAEKVATTDNPVQDGTYLPLLPWERRSLQSERVCAPPTGMPMYCCLGSLSAGGNLDYSPTGCNLGVDVYERAERAALASIAPLPINSQGQKGCDWCRMMDVLLRHNWTMAFQGDSLTRQIFFGIECELRRRGHYNVELHTIYSQGGTKPRWRYGLDDIYELRISRSAETSPTATTTTGTNDLTSVAKVRMYAMYRPLEDMSEVEQYVATQNDILIFDHGLHYGIETGEDVFVAETTNLIQTLLYGSKGGKDSGSQPSQPRPWKLLAWRETSAQHFDTPGGHFLPSVNESYCVPMDPALTNGGNRLRPLLESILRDLNVSPSQLTILPFRKYTSQFHDLHATGDCSHFCTTPSLWVPLWRTLRLAVDNAAATFEHG